MFLPLLYELRARGVSVGATEAVQLARALRAGLHESSVDGFYHTARSLLVHRAGDLDDFDIAFAKVFQGIEAEAIALQDELLDWLREAAEKEELSDLERALIEDLDPEELERMFKERLEEQDERHDGGNKWIGTAGTSPFGHSGKVARPGFRVGGPGGGRSAIKTADARLYKGYREDLTLDVRQMQLALRKLRTYARDGEEELDLDGTIRATAENAGELDIKLRPERRPNTRVILMMDVGGSMDPFALTCSRLFSAAKKSTHFKELKTFYFHNCVYGHVYETERFTDPVRVEDIIRQYGSHYKLIMLGDALMAPYELLSPGGSIRLDDEERLAGIDWLRRLERHFRRCVWLNPEPVRFWRGNTIEAIQTVFEMHPLTLEGLGEAMKYLMRVSG